MYIIHKQTKTSAFRARKQESDNPANDVYLPTMDQQPKMINSEMHVIWIHHLFYLFNLLYFPNFGWKFISWSKEKVQKYYSSSSFYYWRHSFPPGFRHAITLEEFPLAQFICSEEEVLLSLNVFSKIYRYFIHPVN